MTPGEMMVLDASALLAFLRRETGWEAVSDALEGARMSSVSWSETVQKLRQHGGETRGLLPLLTQLGLTVSAFDMRDAERAADLWPHTRARGLSLEDRACLALAQKLGATALTTDRAWADLSLRVPVRLIR